MGVKMGRKISNCLLILLGMLALSLTVFGAAQPSNFHLTILHSNDLHGHGLGDLARQATLIRKIRAQEANVLVLNAGDVYADGKYHHQFYGELEFAVLNALGTDALTLGNNEFKATKGLTARKYLYARINQAKFPVLCANVVSASDGSYLPNVKPYIIRSFSGVKIGILGVSTSEIGRYKQARGFKVLDPLATAKKIYPQVAGQADIVLALTHIGYKRDRMLAKVVPGLAAVVGGHSHTLLMEPKLTAGVPVAQAGKYGKYLGRLDLYFENTGRGWVLKRYQGKMIKLAKPIKKDPVIKAIIDRYLATLSQ
jgi:2',3'-cyclic-nucleotide 2'-phosphodiesterase (5'-nucleotidase family)